MVWQGVALWGWTIVTAGPSRLYTPMRDGPAPVGVEAGARIAAPSRAVENGGAGRSGAAESIVEAIDPSEAAGLTASQIVEAARLSPVAAMALIAVSLAITAGVVWSAFWWWRVKTESRGDAAMRVLSRRMGLGERERARLREVARERGVPAVGLLVCPSGWSG